MGLHIYQVLLVHKNLNGRKERDTRFRLSPCQESDVADDIKDNLSSENSPLNQNYDTQNQFEQETMDVTRNDYRTKRHK